MTVNELAIRLMRRAEAAAEVCLRLRATVSELQCGEPARWAVIMGDSTDEYTVGRFVSDEDAHDFAEDINLALAPVARTRAIAILSSCLSEMADELATVEVG